MVKTLPGAYATMIFFMLMLTFSFLKLQNLIDRKNPIINTNTTPLEVGITYDTNRDEFMMAFAAENYDTGDAISDPRYVRWLLAVYQSRVGSTSSITWYPMHKCTDEEFSRFETTKKESVGAKVKRMHADGDFHCVDWNKLG